MYLNGVDSKRLAKAWSVTEDNEHADTEGLFGYGEVPVQPVMG
nr:hypothetical protein [Stenotrophomonas maltophilia]